MEYLNDFGKQNTATSFVHALILLLIIIICICLFIYCIRQSVSNSIETTITNYINKIPAKLPNISEEINRYVKQSDIVGRVNNFVHRNDVVERVNKFVQHGKTHLEDAKYMLGI